MNLTQMFRAHGIKARLVTGFGIVLVFSVAITALAHWQLTETVRVMGQSAYFQNQVASRTSSMLQLVSIARSSLLNTVILTNRDDIEYEHKQLNDSIKGYQKAYSELKAFLAEQKSSKPLQDQVVALEQESAGAISMVKSNEVWIGDESSREALGNSISTSVSPAFDSWVRELVKLEELRQKDAIQSSQALENNAKIAQYMLLGFASISLLAGVVAAWLISNSVVKPLRMAIEVAEQVAQGDLSQAIDVEQPGEVGVLLEALSKMQGGLRSLVTRVKQAGEGIAQVSSEVAAGNIDLSRRTEHAAGDIQTTAASLQHLSGTVQETAMAAGKAAQTASSASSAASRGGKVISDVAASMVSIDKSSGRITEIIAVIDSIAFQTNILALNASVEAARAGEEGRGFAVVANEVRALANRSAGAAQEIKVLIAESVEAVGQGNAQVTSAVSAMSEITQCVKQVSTIVDEISAATQQQSDELTQVNAALSRLDDMTQQNTALVEQGAAAAQSLSTETEGLQALIGSFRLDAQDDLPADDAYARAEEAFA